MWAVLSAIFAALMTVLAKAGLRGIDPDFAQLIRTAVVLPSLAILVLLTGKWQDMSGWTTRTWFFLVLSGLSTAASWVCYFRALNLGEASHVAAVDKFSVVLVALLATIFLPERVGLSTMCGAGLVTAGLVIMIVAK
jgi:transporter family protein